MYPIRPDISDDVIDYNEEFVNSPVSKNVPLELRKGQTGKSIKQLNENRKKTKLYITIADGWDNLIFYATIMLVLITVTLFVWSLAIHAHEEYIFDDDKNKSTELITDINYYNNNFLKYAKFGLNATIVVCTMLQMYRRYKNPLHNLLSEEEIESVTRHHKKIN